MNVFVLCTGRNGSLTFVKSCSHITNFTSAHESRVQLLGDERVNYPINHIEADNRLSWFLGKLGAKYGEHAFYVHLIRNRDATAKSYNNRWAYKNGIIRAYTQGILMRKEKFGIEFCYDYYDTVYENIQYFLKDKPQKVTLTLENITEEFPKFWEAIRAEGNMELALQEWTKKYNPSQTSWIKNTKIWKRVFTPKVDKI